MALPTSLEIFIASLINILVSTTKIDLVLKEGVLHIHTLLVSSEMIC